MMAHVTNVDVAPRYPIFAERAQRRRHQICGDLLAARHVGRILSDLICLPRVLSMFDISVYDMGFIALIAYCCEVQSQRHAS